MPSDLECRSRGSRLFHCTVLLVVVDGGGGDGNGDGVGAYLSGFNVQRSTLKPPVVERVLRALSGHLRLYYNVHCLGSGGMSQNVTAAPSRLSSAISGRGYVKCRAIQQFFSYRNKVMWLCATSNLPLTLSRSRRCEFPCPFFIFFHLRR